LFRSILSIRSVQRARVSLPASNTHHMPHTDRAMFVVVSSAVRCLLLFHPLCDVCCCFIRCAMLVVVSSAVRCFWLFHPLCDVCCCFIRCAMFVVVLSAVRCLLLFHPLCDVFGCFIRCAAV
jgi:hypothetical protein